MWYHNQYVSLLFGQIYELTLIFSLIEKIIIQSIKASYYDSTIQIIWVFFLTFWCLFLTRSLTMSDIVKHLSEGNLMICLVDWSLLECVWCDRVVSGSHLWFQTWAKVHVQWCCTLRTSLVGKIIINRLKVFVFYFCH